MDQITCRTPDCANDGITFTMPHGDIATCGECQVEITDVAHAPDCPPITITEPSPAPSGAPA
ncbi:MULTISPECIES: hypothetical protein [unclassified Leucobacter]|uniref:hypothetical protein n=1 Tax=unclassified Leucobacter TaxID=2621730 RepID=UPI000621C6F9|nr:hypothetical protein [Leucobacter sp. Ag1]KKI20565.1 hypothetical protein XM48_07565 [Leucobacter sp. Ag1]